MSPTPGDDDRRRQLERLRRNLVVMLAPQVRVSRSVVQWHIREIARLVALRPVVESAAEGAREPLSEPR